MEFTVDTQGISKIAIITSDTPLFATEQDALDTLMSVSYQTEDYKIVVFANQLTPEFLDLKTKLAGGVLQKCINYNIKLAIVGDFSGYGSKALQDFIYEANKGAHYFFLPTIQEALDKLHSF